jgi:hypothetical protein
MSESADALYKTSTSYYLPAFEVSIRWEAFYVGIARTRSDAPLGLSAEDGTALSFKDAPAVD